jgi:gamma-glutamylcyclotransferase (GGCT)/AIG2-like uncharacterized protein YtfP
MSEYLFAYGTLKAGHAPPEIADAVEMLQYVGKAKVRGILFDLGEYPGAVLDPTSANEISGEVFRFPEGATVLERLDEYEGFDPASPDQSLFIRVLQSIALDSGEIMQCWIYIYNRNPGPAPIIAHGRFSL